MDELIDILTENGALTGTTVMKSEAHLRGLFHPTIHVWFYTKEGNILLQKRAKNKDTHPNLWDVSVAGHICAGEEITLAAVREVKEEIGLSLSEEQLHKIGIFKSVQKHSDQLIDCEFHHTFLSELKVPLQGLIKQQSEVDDLKLMTLIQFEEEITDANKAKFYVSHSQAYYATILKEIKNLL